MKQTQLLNNQVNQMNQQKLPKQAQGSMLDGAPLLLSSSVLAVYQGQLEISCIIANITNFKTFNEKWIGIVLFYFE